MKSISEAIAQLQEKLTRDINESGLHPAVLELIVGRMYQEVAQLAKLQAQREREQQGEEEG